jgi:hypothetical protein
MTDEPNNLILEHLGPIRGDIAAVKGDIAELRTDVVEINILIADRHRLHLARNR